MINIKEDNQNFIDLIYVNKLEIIKVKCIEIWLNTLISVPSKLLFN